MWRALLVVLLFLPGPLRADDRLVRLHAPAALVDSGVLEFILPRFSLKTGVKVDVTEGAADARLERGTGGPPVFAEAGGRSYALALEGGNEHAAQFRDWLTSEIGQRTVRIARQSIGWGLGLSGAAMVVAGCNTVPIENLEDSFTLTVKHSTGSGKAVAIDFLWMVDNSTSMCEEQFELSKNFDIFRDKLTNFFAIDPRVGHHRDDR